MIRHLLTGATALGLVACGATTPPRAVPQSDLAAELIAARSDTPPDGPPGACWAKDVTPAVIETVIEQVMVSPPVAGPDGAVLTPATFRTRTDQKIVQDRREVWFRTPCAAELTVSFVATLQRALKARGLYVAPVTGEMDHATRTAIRRFQEPRGLDSEVISLGAARELGIVATDLADL